MDIVSTTTISAFELINFSKDIAQLNLGYLGIAVTILGILGVVFVYFNIKPLKDTLNKQESTIENLKKEAQELLDKSDIKTQSTLESFEKKQLLSLSNLFEQQKENISLEVSNKIQTSENVLLGKIDSISNEKDLSLKEILLSEMTNKILSLEKSLALTIEESNKTYNKEFLLFKNKVDADILELKAYKYDKEGKMGGIIFSIQAIENCIKNEPYLLEFKLKDLKEIIGNYTIDPELFIRLKGVLNAAKEKKDQKLDTLIEEIQALITVQSKPQI